MHENLPAALEAVLFASGAPVTTDKLCDIFQCSTQSLCDAASELQKKYETAGIMLIQLESSYQLCTKSDYAKAVKQALELRRTPPLSRASLEVLAVIAYNQPVTRSFIEQVRGVDSSSIVSSLTDKGLIRERGCLDAPGHPSLFVTTDSFLRCFGLSSLDELPVTGELVCDDGQQMLTGLEEREAGS